MSDGFVDVFFTGTRSGLAVAAAARGRLTRAGCFTVTVGIEDALAIATVGATPPASGVTADSAIVLVAAGAD